MTNGATSRCTSLGGIGRLVASQAQMAAYWTVGVDHHLRLVLDGAQCRVWVDGQLVNAIPAVGDLAMWNRTSPAAFRMGSFRGVIREVTVKRWDGATPNYPSNAAPFQITAFTRKGDGSLQVQWNSTPGKTYTLETSRDFVNWVPDPLTICAATHLSESQSVMPPDSWHRFVRVREGNVFQGQGPLIVSHAEGSVLEGTAVNFKWVGNVPGVQEWQVLAGSAVGGAEYFSSPLLPAASTMYPVSHLPARGETLYLTLRFKWNNAWQEKSFSYKAQSADDLPLEREGIFPVSRPSYHGINQILPLTNRWVIAAVVDIADITARVDQLSGGQLMYYNNLWQQGTPAGNNPNWTAWTQAPIVLNTHLAQARQQLDETRYERTNYYAISSTDDANYSSAREPTTVRQYYTGLNSTEILGAPPVHYAHYCYLEMPEPMVSGRSYTVTLDDGKSATFTYDESYAVSRAIKVNQAGYMPDAGKKFAYIGGWIPKYGSLPLGHVQTFEVVNAQTGAVALTGPVTLRASNPRFTVQQGSSADPATRPLMHGEDLHQIDLSGLTQQGYFFIRVPGVGRSWTFRHHMDAYGEPFYIAARGLFHQRACMKYEMPWTPWKRIKAHTAPVYESELVAFGIGEFNDPVPYERFDIIGGSTDLARATQDVIGGWYDAADYDRNLRHYTNMFDMLYAYELAPAKFADGAMNIPESGNGLPDLLDEVEYGLEVWTRSMTADGGVSGWVETTTHPSIGDTSVNWTFSRRTRWSTLLYSAAAAQFAELVAPLDAAKSNRYRALALRAFAFGNNAANSLGEATFHAKANRGTGAPYTLTWTERDEYVQPYLFHAKLRLYYLTGDSSYLTNVEQHLSHGATPWQWPNTPKDGLSWFYYCIAHRGAGIFSGATINQWRNVFVTTAEALVNQAEAMSYRHSWPTWMDYSLAWGESCMTNRARILFQALALTNDARYRDAALCNLDYMFGANPMGMSWTTGIGFTYPAVINHEVSTTDGIDDPVPGITLYGIDGGPINYMVRNNAWSCPADASGTTTAHFYTDPLAPLYRRWVAHPTNNVGQCEFTVHETMASTIFCCAMLLPDGWTPPDSLKQRRPRHKDSLFGYWYLP
ncbi:MAG: glycoside hydrolase family 9 protein [Roseimicrobium sp.]